MMDDSKPLSATAAGIRLGEALQAERKRADELEEALEGANSSLQRSEAAREAAENRARAAEETNVRLKAELAKYDQITSRSFEPAVPALVGDGLR